MAQHTRAPRPDGTKFEDWIEPITRRGRWGRVSSENKGMVDRCTVDDVAPAFAAEFGIELESVREGTHANEPPDILALVGGHTISIELTELLKESVREKRANDQYVSFDEQLWSESEFVAKLNGILDNKDTKYQRRADGFVADVLLIHSCEHWLEAADAERWIAAATFEPRQKIRSAYFTQEQLPDYPKPHWPLFRLYGSL